MTNIDKLKDFTRLLDEIKSISPSHETSKEVDNLMERIIRDGILPAISEEVAPLLKPTQPEPVPSPESNPTEETSEDSSESEDVEEVFESAVNLDEVIPKTGTPKSGLCVFLKDGSFIQEKKACDTFVKAILEAGVDKVRELKEKGKPLKLNGVQLISDTLDKKYGNQRPIGGGLYVATYSNNSEKKRRLIFISSELNLGWKVEVI